MRTPTVRRPIAALGAIALAGALVSIAPAALAGTAIDKTLAVSGTTRIVVASTFGEIEVRGWDRDEVRLEGSLGARSTLESSLNGGVLTISARPPQGHSAQAPAATHLVVRVPRAARLDVRSIMAAVTVRDLAGALDVSSDTGDVSVEAVSALVQVTSISGAVTVSDPTPGARIALADTSGAVAVSGASGTLSWSSISGSVEVKDCAPARADLSSTSGGIRLRCSIKKDASYRISSKYGPIAFHTLARPDARFSLSTRYGSIQNRLAPPPAGADVRTSRFTIGRGDAAVTMKTESGSIVLE